MPDPPRRDPGPAESTVRRWVPPALVAALVFVVLDALWIGLFAQQLYATELGDRLAEPLVGWAGALFFVVYLVGMLVLVIRPALDARSARTALGRGALLGLTAYTTLGFTNLAVLEDWPVVLSVTNALWGSVLTATTAVITLLVCRRDPDGRGPRLSAGRASPR